MEGLVSRGARILTYTLTTWLSVAIFSTGGDKPMSLSLPAVLPSVLMADLLWLLVACTAALIAPSLLTRRLLWVLAGYIALEAAFHVPMEQEAAQVMRRLSSLRYDYPVYTETGTSLFYDV